MLIKYILAGLFNTFVAFATYYVFVNVILVSPWAANFAGVCLSFVSGFVLSKVFVFESQKRTSLALVGKFGLVLFAQFVVGTVFIYGGIWLGLSKIEAYLVALPFMIAVSFGLQRYWVFGD